MDSSQTDRRAAVPPQGINNTNYELYVRVQIRTYVIGGDRKQRELESTYSIRVRTSDAFGNSLNFPRLNGRELFSINVLN